MNTIQTSILKLFETFQDKRFTAEEVYDMLKILKWKNAGSFRNSSRTQYISTTATQLIRLRRTAKINCNKTTKPHTF